LGRFDLSDIPPAPRGMPQIEVSFDIDANGILNVSAKDKGTGKEQSIIIKASSGLSDEEIEQMVQDAEVNAAEDQKFEEMVQARNTADGMVHSSKKMLEEVGEKASDEEKAAVQAAIEAVEEVLKGDDKEAIEAAVAALTEASGVIAQKMHEDAAAAQGETDDSGEAGADDAVDAEFEEVKDEDKK
jgi:molecular chaperone DnaK